MAVSTRSRKRSVGRTRKPPHASASPGLPCRALREELGLSGRDFARLIGFSERSITAWESGQPMTEPARRKLIELRRFFDSLSGLVKKGTVAIWLNTPNASFASLKPLEVIERGEIDRLWRTLYFLESGEPI